MVRDVMWFDLGFEGNFLVVGWEGIVGVGVGVGYIYVREDGGLDKVGGSRGGKKRFKNKYILSIELIIFVDRFYLGFKGKRGVIN